MFKLLSRFLIFVMLALAGVQAAVATQSLSIVSQNMNRLFDDHDDGLREKVVSRATYQKRIKRLSHEIISTFHQPDILALQEVENIHILQDIAKILQKSGLTYRPVLLEGNDISHINVGFLVRDTLRIKLTRQLFDDQHYPHTSTPLFSRPPLLLQVCSDSCIHVMNLHLRSMRKLDNRSAEGKRIANKRKLQAETIARWVDRFQKNNPESRLILVGDFNALPISDKYVDVLGIIRGNPNQKIPARKSTDLIDRDLIDLTRTIPQTQRYSYVYHKRQQQLDYLLISDTHNYRLQMIKFGPVDYKLSDHAALMSILFLAD
jgi:uncharacterized protein